MRSTIFEIVSIVYWRCKCCFVVCATLKPLLCCCTNNFFVQKLSIYMYLRIIKKSQHVRSRCRLLSNWKHVIQFIHCRCCCCPLVRYIDTRFIIQSQHISIWITFVYVMSTRLDALVRKSLFNVYFGWIQIEFTQCFVVIIYIYITFRQ